jgi:hypothetical protein
MLATVARWPNFGPNNFKKAKKNNFWPGKIGAQKMAYVVQKLQNPDPALDPTFISKVKIKTWYYMM